MISQDVHCSLFILTDR